MRKHFCKHETSIKLYSVTILTCLTSQLAYICISGLSPINLKRIYFMVWTKYYISKDVFGTMSFKNLNIVALFTWLDLENKILSMKWTLNSLHFKWNKEILFHPRVLLVSSYCPNQTHPNVDTWIQQTRVHIWLFPVPANWS